MVPVQANLLGNDVPRASHDLPGQGLYDCSGGSMSSANQDPRPKLVLYEGSFRKGLGRWGHSTGPEPRAHMGLGISVPYISPPLIHTRLPGRIKEPAEPFDLESLMAWDSWLWFLINAHLKRRAVPWHQVQLSLLPDGS